VYAFEIRSPSFSWTLLTFGAYFIFWICFEPVLREYMWYSVIFFGVCFCFTIVLVTLFYCLFVCWLFFVFCLFLFSSTSLWGVYSHKMRLCCILIFSCTHSDVFSYSFFFSSVLLFVCFEIQMPDCVCSTFVELFLKLDTSFTNS